MTDIAHADLTGDNLHEPKGVDNATSGQVYVADGNGSGSWTSISATAFVGMIADFPTPVAPTGWLELDGTDINTTTYSSLFNVMTLAVSGTRSSGSPVIGGLSSTTNIKVGYYAYGTGIAADITVASVDSSSQVTLSGNASSTGTATVYFSPWRMGSGTIRLPDLTTAGRFRRSRTSSTTIGTAQADQNQSHTHSFSATTGSGGSHTHTASVTDPGHSHTYTIRGAAPNLASGADYVGWANTSTSTTVSSTTGVSVSNSTASDHTHSVSGTSGSSGSSEARPLSIVLMTCIKY